MNKVLVIVPHPDDEVLGCGGTIAKHASRGDQIEQVIITKVSRPYWSEDEIKEDALKASGMLGIAKTHFFDMPAVRLDTVPQKELNDSLIALIEELKCSTEGFHDKDDEEVAGRLLKKASEMRRKYGF